MFKWLTKQFNRGSYQVSAGQSVFSIGTRSGQLVNEQTALGLSALWCGIRVISQDVGCLKPIVYRELKSGSRQVDKDHYLNEVFRNPNPEMTGITFRECVQAHALLQTGGFAEIVRRGNGQAAELWPINPLHVLIYRDTDTGKLMYKITLDTKGGPPGAPGQVIDLPQERVFFLPGLTPDGTVAYSLLKVARETLGFGIAASAYGQALFRNGVRPSGTLETPDRLSPESRQNLTKDLTDLHSGADNNGTLLLLEEGLKFNAITQTNEQTQYKDLLNWMVYEIARLLVIPPSKLMSLEKATWGNLGELQRQYLTDCLRPWLEKWEAEIERRLIMPDEVGKVFVEFDTSALLRADMITRYQAYDMATAHQPWMTPDEVRLEENREPLKADKEDDSQGEASEQGQPVADTALSGIQITSLLAVTDKVVSGAYPPDAGLTILQASFPAIPANQLVKVIDSLAKKAEDAPVAPPQAQTSEPPASQDNGQDSGTSGQDAGQDDAGQGDEGGQDDSN